VYRTTCLGEPQLGRRGLYPTLGTKDVHRAVAILLDSLAYADGTRDLIAISDTIGVPVAQLYPLIDRLVAEGLLVEEGEEAAR
jgi:aminopeptidase-like protein